MYVLLTKKPPFNGEYENEIISNIEKCNYDLESPPFDTISNNAKDLIQLIEQSIFFVIHFIVYPDNETINIFRIFF